MNILSFIAATLFAAETFVSPLPDNYTATKVAPPPVRPDITFGNLQGETAATEPTLKPAADKKSPPSPSLSPTSPTPNPQAGTKYRKSSYTIALLGDSMIDTLGPQLPQLKTLLDKQFPGVEFILLNYGVGATNIEYGIMRITNRYEYLGKSVPSLVSTRPDIVVIESFGYNPLSQNEGYLDRHWLDLSKAVETVKSSLPDAKILIAATIAPNSGVFGDGAPGLAFSASDKKSRTDVIKQYLDSTVKFAQGQNLPLADAYHASIGSNGDGRLEYINAGDHIHYSDAGRQFFSQKITDAIVTYHLLD